MKVTFSTDVFFGLNSINVRILAFEFARHVRASYPATWNRDGMADVEWFRSFMSRHPRLSIRTPEATSLARVRAFNPLNVPRFFSNYGALMDVAGVGPTDIWNLDETGVTTVHRGVRIVARRGAKRVGHVTSGERGSLETFVAAVSAVGNRAPPYFVFPRVRLQPRFLNGAPAGSHAGASPSGWITTELFLGYLKHFQAFVRASEQHPIILLMDNHESHCSFPALQFCRENGIHVLSFPPHCSHRLQPLDVGF